MAKEKYRRVKFDKESAETVPPPKVARLVAKKNFRIVHNDYDRQITAGDDLSDVPVMYLANLRTEGVID